MEGNAELVDKLWVCSEITITHTSLRDGKKKYAQIEALRQFNFRGKVPYSLSVACGDVLVVTRTPSSRIFGSFFFKSDGHHFRYLSLIISPPCAILIV